MVNNFDYNKIMDTSQLKIPEYYIAKKQNGKEQIVMINTGDTMELIVIMRLLLQRKICEN